MFNPFTDFINPDFEAFAFGLELLTLLTPFLRLLRSIHCHTFLMFFMGYLIK